MASLETWTAVDHYLTELLVRPDEALDRSLEAATASGLPPISVSPPQGKLLHLIAQMLRAQRILEIGTLAGYSTIWLARALPNNGTLVTLESEPLHVQVAERNITRVGLQSVVQIRLGPAVDTLWQLVDEEAAPFDLIFIDADKPSYPEYLEWSLRLSRPGTVIIADNIVRDGGVINPSHEDPRVHGVRRFNEMVAANPKLNATALQTVGGKGYDGFVLALVTA